jgi:hypothetical protein
MCYTLKLLSPILVDLTCQRGHNVFNCSVFGRKFKLRLYRYCEVFSVPGVVFLFIFQ